MCITAFCFFTVPQSVPEPIRRTWFKGDPQNPTVEVPCFNIIRPSFGNERECSFMLKNLVQGESDGEYRLKLEWGQGKVYIFPQTVKITVKGWLCVCMYAVLTQKVAHTSRLIYSISQNIVFRAQPETNYKRPTTHSGREGGDIL